MIDEYHIIQTQNIFSISLSKMLRHGQTPKKKAGSPKEEETTGFQWTVRPDVIAALAYDHSPRKLLAVYTSRGISLIIYHKWGIVNEIILFV